MKRVFPSPFRLAVVINEQIKVILTSSCIKLIPHCIKQKLQVEIELLCTNKTKNRCTHSGVNNLNGYNGIKVYQSLKIYLKNNDPHKQTSHYLTEKESEFHAVYVPLPLTFQMLGHSYLLLYHTSNPYDLALQRLYIS